MSNGHGDDDVSHDDDPVVQSRLDRLRARQASVVGRIERTRDQLEAKRPSSRVLDTTLAAFERDVAAGGGVLAGAVAFRVFLFMIPYVFMVVVVFGLGASATDEDPARLARNAGIGGVAAKAFAGIGDLSTGQRIVTFVVVGFALLLATRSLLKVLRIVHALVWHTRAGKPPSMARAAGVLVLVVTMALGVAALIGKVRTESVGVGLLATILFALVPFAVWLVVSWYMPHVPDIPWTALIPGAACFGIGLELLHLVTVYWIANRVEHKTDTYGAIGFALALLLWAYLLGRLITSAAVINETLWSRHRQRRRAHDAVATRRSGDLGDQPARQAPGEAGRSRREHGSTEGEDEHAPSHDRP